jgi:hypothetical protein
VRFIFVEKFHGETGLHKDILDLEKPTPVENFLKFWPMDLLEIICFQTNLYAQQLGKHYQPTTIEEVKTFLGLNLIMGIKKSPSYRDYWSSSPDLHDAYISKFMPVNRFGWLLSHLHVNDNAAMPARGNLNYHKLYKVRPLVSSLKQSFRRNYNLP